jgi:DNA-binding LytR/AlgR family response regulator
MRLFTFDKTKLADIFFFEADRNYTTVYYDNGHRDVYTIPLKRFHEFLLHEPDFVRIHKSYLVNRQFIKTIARDHIQLYNGQQLPVARRREVQK